MPASHVNQSATNMALVGRGEQSGIVNDDQDITQLDDFEVVAERARVISAIAALTDRYRQLNQEMTRRETLQWMVR